MIPPVKAPARAPALVTTAVHQTVATTLTSRVAWVEAHTSNEIPPESQLLSGGIVMNFENTHISFDSLQAFLYLCTGIE
jgi:hypothetical protein